MIDFALFARNADRLWQPRRRRDVTIVAKSILVEEIGRKIVFFADPYRTLFALEADMT